MSEKWLVIGGTGLIGSELCIELRSKGYVVHSVSRKSSFHPDHLIADVTETEWLKLIDSNFYDYVVYLAYSSSIILSESKIVNVDGVLKLATHFHGSKLRSFVYLGSMTIFGQFPSHDVITELASKVPNGIYASNKAIACEQLMGHSFTFRLSILHPTNVYSRESKSIKNWGKVLSMNRINSGKYQLGVRNMVHSNDVANAVIEVSRRVVGSTNEEFIVNGEIVSWKDFFELVSIRPPNKRILPLFLANLTKGPIRSALNKIGFVTPLKPPKYKLKMMACNSIFDNQKLREMTGWVPKKTFKLEMRSEK